MKQVIRTPDPYSKKLFEWDADNGLLEIVANDKVHIYQLIQRQRFVHCISSPKNSKEAKLIRWQLNFASRN